MIPNTTCSKQRLCWQILLWRAHLAKDDLTDPTDIMQEFLLPRGATFPDFAALAQAIPMAGKQGVLCNLA